MNSLEYVKSFNGLSVNGETWNKIRHNPNVKLISMLGIHDPEKGIKHEIILNNKQIIFVYLN